MICNETQINIPVCGIDTIEIISDKESKADLSTLLFVHSASRVRLADNKMKYVVNPDKANGNRTITSYSEYQKVFEMMIEKMELTNPSISRIDYRFDRYSGNYKDSLKLNTALLLLLSQEYKVRNKYSSKDLLTAEDLTIRIQNKYFESEYYNKRIESPNESIESRLELRTKCLADGADEVNELDLWFARIDKAVTRTKYRELLETINYHLILEYKSEKESNPSIKPNEFLYEHRSRIFSRNQLKEFYSKLGYGNPNEAAKKFISRRNVETVSYKEIQDYINVLIIASETFKNQ